MAHVRSFALAFCLSKLASCWLSTHTGWERYWFSLGKEANKHTHFSNLFNSHLVNSCRGKGLLMCYPFSFIKCPQQSSRRTIRATKPCKGSDICEAPSKCLKSTGIFTHPSVAWSKYVDNVRWSIQCYTMTGHILWILMSQVMCTWQHHGLC